MSGRIGRRDLLKWGLPVGVLSLVPRPHGGAPAQTFRREDAEKVLYPAPGLPGGGQMEIRMVASPDNPDPDELEVAHRLKPFNLESWHGEWKRVAEKNEELAGRIESEGRKVTANEFYLRAARFYRSAVVYLAESDPRMLPTYHKLREMFDKAWGLVPPPFERVEIPYEGQTLEGHFHPVRAAAGQRSPVVFNYAGADGILLSGAPDGGSSQYRQRGMAYFNLDGPGQGGSLRLKKIYAPPDCERVAKAVVDYLVTRRDVDPNRIAIHGSSMGGYSAPQCATVEKRLKAVAVWSGAYGLREDIFDYYPPIQERLRWLIGARDLVDAQRKIGEFTLEGRAQQIECPMLIGYNIDDRIMDPRGALKLYEKATRSKREMLEGVGHGERRFELRTYIADWFAKQLGTL